MASDNTILTALGLDLSQFEKGTSQAVSATRPLLGAIATVDSQLRQIPVVGQIYAATFGQIAQGFAETRVAARDFARIMGTDVSGSLDGTLDQIDEINEKLKTLKEGSFSRSVVDVFQRSLMAITAGTYKPDVTPNQREEQRQQQIAEYEAAKEKRFVTLGNLLDQQVRAQSAIVSGSQEETENERINIDFQKQKLALRQQAFKIGGPDETKWSEELTKSLEDQLAIYGKVAAKQGMAAAMRRDDRKLELAESIKIAEHQSRGNDRDIAQTEYKLAQDKAANAERAGVKEDIAAANAAKEIAYFRLEASNHAYEIAVKQGNLETAAMEARVTGQGRIAKQLEIQARYQVQIDEAMRHGNTEIAKQLAAQQKAEQLAEAIREYRLGGHGRAVEQREERRNNRIAIRAEKWATHHSAGMARNQKNAAQTGQKPIPNATVEGFMARVLKKLEES